MSHTILIVDDSPDDIELTRMALAEMGRDVRLDSAMRGTEAIEYLRGEHELPSLILLDLKMPGMNGIDTLRQIRADERSKEIPVIIATSSNLDADKNEAYETGADSFLHKDFSLDRFSRNLDSLLHRFLNN